MAMEGGTTGGTTAVWAPGLRRDAIGLREVLFQSITDMAPGAAIAASIPAGAAYAGGSLPLAVLFALIACLLSASCVGVLAREMPAAGSLATYAARGLHPAIGFLVAWGYVLVGALISPLVLLQLGFTVASTINSEWHSYPANLWWPWAVLGALIVLANSTIANANAGVNVSSRTAYAMGRIGAFPHFFARVHHKHSSPVIAIFATFVVTIAVTLGLGLGYGPVTAFAMVGTGLVIVLAAIYIVINAACIGFFAKRRRGWNPLLHLVIPVLGIAAFVPAWLVAAGIKAFSFVTPLTAPSSYMGPGVAGFMVVGIGYLIYLYARHPSRVTEVGLVHLDDAEITED